MKENIKTGRTLLKVQEITYFYCNAAFKTGKAITGYNHIQNIKLYTTKFSYPNNNMYHMYCPVLITNLLIHYILSWKLNSVKCVILFDQQ